MRLTAKFLAVMLAVIGLVLAIATWQSAERERDLFDAELRQDAAVAGRLLADGVIREEHLTGRVAADEAVARAASSTGYQVEWLPLQTLPVAVATALATGATVTLRDEDAGPDGSLEVMVPVPLRQQAGALRLTSTLRSERRYLRATFIRSAIVSLALFAAAATAAALFGLGLIARPTRLLVASAQRIGAGHLDGRIDLPQRDELGTLGRELNAMTERLAAARDRIEAEARARLAAVEQLRHADRLMTVGRLSSGIAHELGTPLNVIEGHARMIESGEAAGAEITDSAQVIIDQTRKVTAIVRQLLDFARRGGGHRLPADLRPLIQQSARLLQAPARRAQVALEARASDDPVCAAVDDAQMLQVLTNLLVNAIQATPAGGRITVELARAERAAPLGIPGERWAVLTVADTGTGMDAAVRERIFEPFFTTKEVGQGTGLGLSVVHGIVQDHGGWIDVDSAPGQGSRFSVYLPAVA